MPIFHFQQIRFRRVLDCYDVLKLSVKVQCHLAQQDQMNLLCLPVSIPIVIYLLSFSEITGSNYSTPSSLFIYCSIYRPFDWRCYFTWNFEAGERHVDFSHWLQLMTAVMTTFEDWSATTITTAW